jgi:hypothetical protein
MWRASDGGLDAQAVARAHGIESTGRMIVEEEAVTGNERHEMTCQVGAARHPLEIASATMRVRPIELATRKGRFKPPEEPLVACVHAQSYVRLPAVPTKVPLAYQQSDQKTDRKWVMRLVLASRQGSNCHREKGSSIATVLFHRHVSRGTTCERGGCRDDVSLSGFS